MMKFNQIMKICVVMLFCLLGFALPVEAQWKKNCAEISWLEGGAGKKWDRTQSQRGPKPGAKPKNYALACATKDFKKFFKSFSEDDDFQSGAILFPLKSTTTLFYDEDEADYRSTGMRCKNRVCTEYLNPPKGHKGGYNLFPNKRQRACDDLDYIIKADKKNPDTMVVTLYKRGAGDNFHYIFVWDGCWFMSEMK